MDQKRKNAVELWITEDLPPITAVLKELAPELAKRPIQNFNTIFEKLVTVALEKFMMRYGVVSGDDLTTKDMAAFLKHIISSLNAVLPLNHPYIALLFFDETENKLHPATARRKLIPGAHDLLESNIVPIIKWRGQETFKPGDCVFLEKTELEDSGASPEDDELENMWKKS